MNYKECRRIQRMSLQRTRTNPEKDSSAGARITPEKEMKTSAIISTPEKRMTALEITTLEKELLSSNIITPEKEQNALKATIPEKELRDTLPITKRQSHQSRNINDVNIILCVKLKSGQYPPYYISYITTILLQ